MRRGFFNDVPSKDPPRLEVTSRPEAEPSPTPSPPPQSLREVWLAGMLQEDDRGTASKDVFLELKGLKLIASATDLMCVGEPTPDVTEQAVASLAKALLIAPALDTAPQLHAALRSQLLSDASSFSEAALDVFSALEWEARPPTPESRRDVFVGLYHRFLHLEVGEESGEGGLGINNTLSCTERMDTTLRVMSGMCEFDDPEHPDMRELLWEYAPHRGSARIFSWLAAMEWEAGDHEMMLRAAKWGFYSAMGHSATWMFTHASLAVKGVVAGCVYGRGKNVHAAELEPLVEAMQSSIDAANAVLPPGEVAMREGRKAELRRAEHIFERALQAEKKGIQTELRKDGLFPKARDLLVRLRGIRGSKQVLGRIFCLEKGGDPTGYSFDMKGGEVVSADPSHTMRILRSVCRPGNVSTVVVRRFVDGGTKNSGFYVQDGEVTRLTPDRVRHAYEEFLDMCTAQLGQRCMCPRCWAAPAEEARYRNAEFV